MVRRMKRIWPYVLIGVILIAVGLVWTLQGVGVMGGSAMSGSSLWATVGPIVLVAGIVLIGVGIGVDRSKRRRQG